MTILLYHVSAFSKSRAQVEWNRLQLRCAYKRNFTITEGSAGIMKFHIIELADEPEGYVNVSNSAEWESWIRHCLPDGLNQEVRRRLVSNLKHGTVGLELKAALSVHHAERGAGPSLLFEPYQNIMHFKFCVVVISICAGVGASLGWIENKLRVAAARRIGN